MSDFLEKTLEDIIYENQDTIHERGFPALHNNTYRQFPLPSGRFIDLLSFTIEKNVIYISLFELKKENLNIDSLLQLLSYGSEVRVLCSPHFSRVEMDMVLIGSDYDEKIGALLAEMLPVEIYLYKYLINGIFFKRMQSTYELMDHEEIKKTILYSIFEKHFFL